MPKLAIYVPRDDMKIVEKWRKKLNFSKIFMRALQQEIERQSRVVKSPSDKVAAAAAYYKQELSRNSKSLVDFAFELGSEQVLECRLDAQVIRRLLSIEDPGKMSRPQQKTVTTALKEQRPEIESFLLDNGYDENTFPTVRQELARGYIQGVAAAWEQLRKKM